MSHNISLKDKESIQKFFEASLEEMDQASFKKKLRALRAKYHPDNFEKFEDETIREMATEKFQYLEDLAEKMDAYFSGKASGGNDEAYMNVDALFAIRKLKIEIRTADKDLKYKLFGSQYRWLVYGDSYKIPDTTASIIIDENHQGVRIGFKETIRMYLSFEEDASIEQVVEWLFENIKTGADSLIIAGEIIPVERMQIIYAIKKQSFLRIAAP